jgi:hypothetical protein
MTPVRREPRVVTLVGLDAVRTLRAEVMGLALAADREPDGVRVLRLEAPRMTPDRISEEWGKATRVLRPSVRRRLRVECVPGRPGVTTDDGAASVRLPPPDFPFIVLKLLVSSWLVGRGPLTARWLAQAAGCSYPTVLGAIRQLGPAVTRGPARRVGLAEFPRREWARLLLLADRARSTVRLADRSGHPRSAASLAERLREIRPEGMALGGVLGARHHHPELDIVGLPRLDVSVHAPGKAADLAFVRRLDPGLEATSDPAEPARLVVHFVRHADPLFEKARKGLSIADPAECLLDLHEAGFEPQAVELVSGMRARVPGTR